jgi:hypothetical protein
MIPKPTHKWTIEEQKVLLVIDRWFDYRQKDMHKLLNAYFPQAVVQFSEIMARAARNQIKIATRGSVGHKTWVLIYQHLPFERPGSEITAVIERLERIACRSGVMLERRHTEDPNCKYASPRTQKTLMDSASKLSRSLPVSRRRRASAHTNDANFALKASVPTQKFRPFTYHTEATSSLKSSQFHRARDIRSPTHFLPTSHLKTTDSEHSRTTQKGKERLYVSTISSKHRKGMFTSLTLL